MWCLQCIAWYEFISFCRHLVSEYVICLPNPPVARRQHVAPDILLCCLLIYLKYWNVLLPLSLQNWDTMLKNLPNTYQLLIYVDMHYVTNLSCKKCAKNWENPYPCVVNCIFFISFFYYYHYICVAHIRNSSLVKLCTHLYICVFILRSLCSVSCYPHTYCVLLNLPTLHRRVSRPVIGCSFSSHGLTTIGFYIFSQSLHASRRLVWDIHNFLWSFAWIPGQYFVFRSSYSRGVPDGSLI